MTARGYPIATIARILIDAEDPHLGAGAAAKKHGVTRRAITKWRARCKTDEALRNKLAELVKEIEQHWAGPRVKALRVALERATTLLENETDLDKVTRFIEKVGSVDVAGKLLGTDDPVGDPEGDGPAGTPSSGASGTDPQERLEH